MTASVQDIARSASDRSRVAAAERSPAREGLLPNGSGRAKLPSLDKEGWPRHQTNDAKPPWMERTGWFVQLPIIGSLTNHPSRQLRKLRSIFLKAQPPLIQGGEFRLPLTVRQHALARGATLYIALRGFERYGFGL